MDFSKLIPGFLLVVTGIFRNWYLDFSWLLHGFFEIDTWIPRRCYMDFSKLINEFFKLDKWISLSYYMGLKLFHGFFKVVLYFLALCQKKIKLKFDQGIYHNSICHGDLIHLILFLMTEWNTFFFKAYLQCTCVRLYHFLQGIFTV